MYKLNLNTIELYYSKYLMFHFLISISRRYFKFVMKHTCAVLPGFMATVSKKKYIDPDIPY